MSIDHEVKAIREGAAVLRRADVRTLEVVGPDRVRFLNGMVSNDVSRLSPGQGTIAIKTTNRGRVEGVLRVRAREDALLLDLLDVVADRVRGTLERFIVMDDCAVNDVSSAREVVSVFGERSRTVLGALGFGPDIVDLEMHAYARLGDLEIVRDGLLGVHGYEIHAPAGDASALIADLLAHGATPITPEALDIARIEAGVPIDGRDLDDETIPMEARLERAINLSKGCYVGQEVLARATNFGQVKHILIGLVFDGGAAPEAGASLVLPSDGSPVGELTSVARSRAVGAPIALGYVKRVHEAPGTRLDVPLATGGVAHATIVELPFVKAPAQPR